MKKFKATQPTGEKISYLRKKLNAAKQNALNSGKQAEVSREDKEELEFLATKLRTEANDVLYRIKRFNRSGSKKELSAAVDALSYLIKDSSSFKKFAQHISLNSSTMAVGASPLADDDADFMEDVSKILALESGETLDLDKTYLAYNADTKELVISDEPETDLDEGFDVVADVTVTKSDVDESEELGDEEQGQEEVSREETETEETIEDRTSETDPHVSDSGADRGAEEEF